MGARVWSLLGHKNKKPLTISFQIRGRIGFDSQHVQLWRTISILAVAMIFVPRFLTCGR